MHHCGFQRADGTFRDGVWVHLRIGDAPDGCAHGEQVAADEGLAVALSLHVLSQAHAAILTCKLRL